MRGNVWEWVQDRYGPYSAEWQVDPQGPPSGDADRVVRGGSWGVVIAYRFRCAYRFHCRPGFRDDYLGFRCARTVL